jgi:uncharacterized RDD family membrane protein YckC
MSNDSPYTLETPESISLDFELAGPGSRLCAALIDMLVISILLTSVFIIWVLGAGGGSVLFGTRGGTVDWSDWGTAVLILMVFVLFSGYHLLFEILWRGQTPGKWQLEIRAIRDDGTPMSGTDVLVRNLIRMVDFLPAFYALGGGVCLLHPMHKRLGDLAAGTIVVKESEADYRGRTDKKYLVAEAPLASARVELTPEEHQILSGFLRRREELLFDARERLAKKLAEPLHEKYGGHYIDPESYIERLLSGEWYEEPQP